MLQNTGIRAEEMDEGMQRLIYQPGELEEEKARQMAMIQNIGDGIVGFNDKGEITFINKQVEVMTGWTQNELGFTK